MRSRRRGTFGPMKVGPKSGLVKTTVYLRPDQLKRLHDEARRRAAAAGQLRPDASAVLREAVDAGFAKQAKK